MLSITQVCFNSKANKSLYLCNKVFYITVTNMRNEKLILVIKLYYLYAHFGFKKQ